METRTRKTPGNLLEFQSLFRVKQQNVKRWPGSRSGFIAATRAFRGKRKYYPKYSGDGRRPLWQYVFSLGKYFIGRESSRSCDPGSRASQKSGKLLNLASLLSASIVLSPVFQQCHKTHYLRVNRDVDKFAKEREASRAESKKFVSFPMLHWHHALQLFSLWSLSSRNISRDPTVFVFETQTVGCSLRVQTRRPIPLVPRDSQPEERRQLAKPGEVGGSCDSSLYSVPWENIARAEKMDGERRQDSLAERDKMPERGSVSRDEEVGEGRRNGGLA